MATGTAGTNATTSLTALRFLPGYNSGMAPADVATISEAILDDLSNGHPNIPASFSYNGNLYIPRRGVLKLHPGDVVAVDTTTGWPILISKLSALSGPWTTTV